MIVYVINYCYRAESVHVPKMYEETVRSPESDLWKEAMNEEMNSLKKKNTFDEIKLPHGNTLVGGRWVFAWKCGLSGEGIIYKAQYVAKGYTQEAGIDYSETFAPAAQFQFNNSSNRRQNSYLNVEIDHEIYIKQPKRFVVEKSDLKGELVWKLN